MNVGRLFRGEPALVSCTPAGVQQMLLRTGNDPAGKHVVICGRSNLVGKPLAGLLMQKARGGNATVTICHTGTPDIAEHTRHADILVAAMGRPRTITADMVRAGRRRDRCRRQRASRTRRRRAAGVWSATSTSSRAQKAAAITPVPGGVGPMTRAMLLANTIVAARGGPGARR